MCPLRPRAGPSFTPEDTLAARRVTASALTNIGITFMAAHFLVLPLALRAHGAVAARLSPALRRPGPVRFMTYFAAAEVSFPAPEEHAWNRMTSALPLVTPTGEALRGTLRGASFVM
jgi:hypothetical protein